MFLKILQTCYFHYFFPQDTLKHETKMYQYHRKRKSSRDIFNFIIPSLNVNKMNQDMWGLLLSFYFLSSFFSSQATYTHTESIIHFVSILSYIFLQSQNIKIFFLLQSNRGNFLWRWFYYNLYSSTITIINDRKISVSSITWFC